jgi:hypothetical protein
MRHLALLFTLLFATFGLAASAKALTLPPSAVPLSTFSASAAEDEAEDGTEAPGEEESEGEEAEACEAEEEGCEEEAEEADECVLESTNASVSASASGKVRVTVRYSAATATTVALDYSLRGAKGGLHLGSARAQFQRVGVFHDALNVGGRKLNKLLAARRFVVDLHALGTPGYCREELTQAAPHRAKRRHRAGA